MSPTPEEGENENKVTIKKEPVIEIEDDDDICELEHLRKLFIGGLASYTTEETLKSFYEKWGKVVDVVVMRDPITKRSRGFGFVTYTKSECVNKAQANRPHLIDGKVVEAKRALQRPDRENREVNISVKKLFVGGLKDNHDEDALKDYFSQFGNVVSVKLLTDRTTGKRRGFAFVEFDDYDSVDKAILQKEHSIKYVVVDVKKSVYKQELQNRQNRFENGGKPNDNKSFNNLAKTMPPKPGVSNGRTPHGYPMGKPPVQQMPYQQPPPPINGVPQGPPPNYNYWGPPPPMQQPYGNGYQCPPPQNNWNYASAPNNWNTPPQQPPPVGNWQNNQWGYGPPPPGPPPANWNAPIVPPAQVPPPGTPNAVPPTRTNQPPPAATKPPPPNFGTGYQQNFGGGPVKHNAPNSNRMNPYSAPPTNGYGGNGPVPPPGYGNNPVPPAVPVPPVGGNYHR